METRHIYTVSEFTRQLKGIIASSFSRIAVEGEISGLSVSGRGHMYFSLQDQGALLSCIVWQSKASAYGQYIKQGNKVIVSGRMDLYEKGGRYSLVADRVEPAGLGKLLIQLQKLRMRLQKEGLFDQGHKRELPKFPRKIGIVTAQNGAAVRDVVKTVIKRMPAHIVIAPAKVQGDGAAKEIINGMQRLSQIPDMEVIIIGRGGGSFEDLFQFNDEALVRAVAASPVPIISAVGHERDESLTDLVADRRAGTPTAAGQMVVPERGKLMMDLDAVKERLTRGLSRRLDTAEMEFDAIFTDLLNTGRMREQSATRLLQDVSIRLLRHNPMEKLRGRERALSDLEHRLVRAGHNMLKYKTADLEHAHAAFVSKDPFGPLNRGYAMLQRADGVLVRGPKDVSVGNVLTGILKQGRICLNVEKIGECKPSKK